MFRATMCPSSGEITVSMRHLVLVTLYGWLSGMQGGMKQIHSTPHTRQSSIQSDKHQVSHRYSYFSDDVSFHPAYQSHPYRVTSNKCRIDTVISPDDISFHPAYQNHPYRVTSTKCRIHSYFFWWWALSHPKHVRKRNKHTKKNCAPSWLYLQDYTRMHGQQNMKYLSFTYSFYCIAPLWLHVAMHVLIECGVQLVHCFCCYFVA
jgi:hypothetical protein